MSKPRAWPLWAADGLLALYGIAVLLVIGRNPVFWLLVPLWLGWMRAAPYLAYPAGRESGSERLSWTMLRAAMIGLAFPALMVALIVMQRRRFTEFEMMLAFALRFAMLHFLLSLPVAALTLRGLRSRANERP